MSEVTRIKPHVAAITTEHEEANEAIERLRGAAIVLAELGDMVLHLEKERDELQRTIDTYGSEISFNEMEVAAYHKLLDLVRDVELGCADLPELFKLARSS